MLDARVFGPVLVGLLCVTLLLGIPMESDGRDEIYSLWTC